MTEQPVIELGGLAQSVHSIPPKALLANFDYVGKPYADALDALAVALILLIVNLIVSKLVTIPFNSSTKSFAIISLFNRLTQFSLAAFNSKRSFSQLPVNCFSNLLQRVIAFAFFFMVICVELLVLFSQTSPIRSRSVNELRIRSLELQHVNASLARSIATCNPLVSTDTSSTNVHLFLCAYPRTTSFFDSSFVSAYNARPHPNSFTGSVEVEFDWSQDWEFRVSDKQSTGQQSSISYRIELSDSTFSRKAFANLTQLGFRFSSSQVFTLADIFQRMCQCNLSILSSESAVSFSFPRLSLQHPSDLSLFRKSGAELLNSMVRLSNRTYSNSNFITGDDQIMSKDELNGLVNEVASERVKRLSGIILYCLVALLTSLNLVLKLCIIDNEEKRVRALRAVVELPSELSFSFSDNVTLTISDESENNISLETAESSDCTLFNRTLPRVRKRSPHA